MFFAQAMPVVASCLQYVYVCITQYVLCHGQLDIRSGSTFAVSVVCVSVRVCARACVRACVCVCVCV